jgi:bacterioferritin-associated ferredoxin
MTNLDAITDDCEGICAACPAVGSCADRVVCRCLKVTETVIIGAIRGLSLTTVTELKRITGAGDGCTCCHRELKQYLRVYSPIEATAELMAASS